MNAENKKDAPAAGKGVDDAMVEQIIDRASRENGVGRTDGMDGDSWDRLLVRAALEAALTRQPVAGDGMVLVPREPTEEMLRAGWNAYLGDMKGGAERFAITYRAMIAAAPAATPTDGGEG